MERIRIEAADVLREPGVVATRETFLTDPFRMVWQSGVQPEWVAEAYRTNEAFRRNMVTYALARSVIKCGAFDFAAGWLDVLRPHLTEPEVVGLYEGIREQAKGERLELEWRPRFAAAFPGVADQLPAIGADEVRAYWEPELFDAIVVGRSGEEAAAILRELASGGVDLGSLSVMYRYLFDKSGRFYRSPPEDEDSMTFSELAEHVGAHNLAELLCAAGCR
jgi:hypothetical protein